MELVQPFHPAPFPDLALLKVNVTAHREFKDHPCVRLDTVADVNTPVFIYEYPKDRRSGDPVTGFVEGPAPFRDSDAITARHQTVKFKGQVQEGASGAPLLNLRTLGVCGIVQFSRNKNSDLGGVAASTQIIFECFP